MSSNSGSNSGFEVRVSIAFPLETMLAVNKVAHDYGLEIEDAFQKVIDTGVANLNHTQTILSRPGSPVLKAPNAMRVAE